MGITAPSLYTAFGDKRRLFLEAARRYFGDPDQSAVAIDDAATAFEASRSMLAGAVIAFTGEDTPPGCLLASATASGSAASYDVQAVIAGYRSRIRDHLQRRIERDVTAGLLPDWTDASTLATLVLTIVQGLSVMARDGMPRASLASVADASLRAWPQPSSL